MLDTIVLMLPERAYDLRRPERFIPHASALCHLYAGRGPQKAIYNPTALEKASGYKPRLTLYRRPSSEILLKIEFSAPKIVFGNNFEELRWSDQLDQVIRLLVTALETMGVSVRPTELRSAPVTAIHYSKNILLDRSTPAWLVIGTLAKIDVNQKLDLAHTTFRNGGIMAKYHSASYEICVYDKVRDLERATRHGDGRGAETDYACQTNLFANRRRKPEVIRFEVRLTARKLKTLLPRLGIERERTLSELFSADLSQAILLHYWRQMTDGLFAECIDADGAEVLIKRIHDAFPLKRPGKVAELMGFALASRDLGIRGARLALELEDWQFYRLRRELKALDDKSRRPHYSVLSTVGADLKEFVPFTRTDLEIQVASEALDCCT